MSDEQQLSQAESLDDARQYIELRDEGVKDFGPEHTVSITTQGVPTAEALSAAAQRMREAYPASAATRAPIDQVQRYAELLVMDIVESAKHHDLGLAGAGVCVGVRLYRDGGGHDDYAVVISERQPKHNIAFHALDKQT